MEWGSGACVYEVGLMACQLVVHAVVDAVVIAETFKEGGSEIGERSVSSEKDDK